MCKLFDAYTPFTVGLLHLLYRHFEKFCLVKPCVPKHTATDYALTGWLSTLQGWPQWAAPRRTAPLRTALRMSSG